MSVKSSKNFFEEVHFSIKVADCRAKVFLRMQVFFKDFANNLEKLLL